MRTRVQKKEMINVKPLPLFFLIQNQSEFPDRAASFGAAGFLRIYTRAGASERKRQRHASHFIDFSTNFLAI